MKKVLLALLTIFSLVALVLAVVSLAEVHGAKANARSEVSALRRQMASDLSKYRSSVAKYQATVVKLSAEVSSQGHALKQSNKVIGSTKIGYCVQYYDPTDSNLVSYNETTTNYDYSTVYSLVQSISTPFRQNGVYECVNGGTFVAMSAG